MARGSYVISCRQIEVEGLRLLRPSDIAVGAAWRWTGEAAEIDADRDLPVLADALGEVVVRQRAARQVRRMLAPVLEPVSETVLEPVLRSGSRPAPQPLAPPAGADGVLTVSDGYHSFGAVLLGTGGGTGPGTGIARSGYTVFAGRMPPAGMELRVTGLSLRPGPSAQVAPRTGFPKGARVSTVTGAKRVEDLVPGDLVETRDGPPRALAWIGHEDRGETRAVRLPPNIFGPGMPLAPVTLAPEQGVLVRHPSAERLFGVREVMVAARDLVAPGFARDCVAAGPRYRLLFDAQETIWVGGVPCASLHARDLSMSDLPDDQRMALVAAAPDLYRDPSAHGAPVRRRLSGAEAALLFDRPRVTRLSG